MTRRFHSSGCSCSGGCGAGLADQANFGSSRRDFFSRMGDGLYGAALAYLIGEDLFSPSPVLAASPTKVHDLMPRAPHFEPKAKAVIQLFMTGGPSQVDLFDPKPALEKYAGQTPKGFLDEVESISEAGGLMPSPYKFAKHGKSGIEVSDVLPHVAACVDDLCLIRSMWTDNFAHEAAIFTMHTGHSLPAFPSMGAWVAYGLGTENQDLPAYVVLDDMEAQILLGIQNWQSGWLPPIYQGTRFRSEGPPVVNLHAKEEFPDPVLELSRTLLRRIDMAHQSKRTSNPDLGARLASYALAARMQVAASDAVDIEKESEPTREMYGLNDPVTASYGRRCLMARRLVERGVRIVQIYMNCASLDVPWDHHSDLEASLRQNCAETDKPVAGLLKDLKQRGMLESTLVIWGGEFGRLPLSQGGGGRDHGAAGFTVWLAGGGVRGGTVYGATDEFGYHAVENRVSVRDFHATILHLLGLDHEKLVYDHNGLKERLSTFEPARVIQEIVA